MGKMNSILSKHQKSIEQVISSHRERLLDLQNELAKKSDGNIDPTSLRFLNRLEKEYCDILSRFENLAEAIDAVLPRVP